LGQIEIPTSFSNLANGARTVPAPEAVNPHSRIPPLTAREIVPHLLKAKQKSISVLSGQGTFRNLKEISPYLLPGASGKSAQVFVFKVGLVANSAGSNSPKHICGAFDALPTISMALSNKFL